MTTTNYLSGYAFVKKVGDTMHVFEPNPGSADNLPVVAEGSNTPRTLKQRFADVVNVKDFGAVGDGVHDDTAAIRAADSFAANRGVDLLGLTVKTDAWPSRKRFVNGYFLHQGKLTNVTGSGVVSGAYYQKHLCDLQILDANGTRVFEHSTYAAQGIAYLNVDGVEKIYMSVRTYGVELPYAYQKCRIAEYTLDAEGGELSLVAVTPELPIGHGQGLGAQVVGGEVYLYSMETGVPARYKASGENFGKGLTRIRYRGSATTSSDVTSYRLAPFVKATKDFDNLASIRMLTPTLSPDGKKLVGLCGNRRVYVWDLEGILKCSKADSDYTWSDAGTGESETNPDDPYQPAANRIDATSVKPDFEFAIDVQNTAGQQGIACDDRYIYVSSGQGNPALATAVDVYDWSGAYVKTLWHGGARALHSTTQLFGLDSALGVLTTNENEGLFVRGDDLCCLMMSRWRPAGDVVTYAGKNYVCLKSCKGQYPTTFADGYWAPTYLSANKGAWNPNSDYAGADQTQYVESRQRERRIVLALTSNVGDKALSGQNDLLRVSNGYQGSYEAFVPKGNNFTFGFYNPYTGERENKLLINDRHFYLYDSDGMGGSLHFFVSLPGTNEFAQRNYVNISAVDSLGKDGGKIRLYSTDDPNEPGSIEVMSSAGTRQAIFRDAGTFLRVGTSANNRPLAFGADVDTNDYLMYAGGSHSYLMSVNRNMTIGRLETTADGQIKYRARFGVFANMFAPFEDDKFSIGNAGLRISELYASTSAINTSDEREKTSIVDPDEALMRAWGKVNFKVFQFKDAVEKKGTDARLHVGVIAQQVIEAFESEGLDATRYGLLCYDKWEDEYEDIEVIDEPEAVAEDGAVTPAKTHIEHRLVTPAGNRYGIRYEEALALEAAYQRWKLQKIEATLVTMGVKL